MLWTSNGRPASAGARLFRSSGAMVAAGLLLLGLQGSASVASGAACGTLPYSAAAPPRYDHVVIIMEENLSYSSFQSLRAANPTPIPYMKSLVTDCGSERSMHAATHPSQPNYMAATSGVPTGVHANSPNNNVFHQAQSTSRSGVQDSWRAYAQGMATNCGGDSGFYKTGHNPAYWYNDLRTPVNTCKAYDVPQSALDTDLASDTLPTYAWITPNECNNMHWVTGCPDTRAHRFATSDTYLQSVVGRIIATPSYRMGQTLVIVTWDEGEGGSKGIDCTDSAVYSKGSGCHIPTIVVSPYIAPGATDSSDQNLYSLLGTTEDILGYPRLGRAVTNPQSMRPGLRF